MTKRVVKTTTTAAPASAVAAVNTTATYNNVLSQKAILANLSISRWGARRYDRKVTQEIHEKHNASSESGRYRKRLLEKGAMKDINTIIAQAREFHYRMTQPWLDDGTRVLPTALYVEYIEQMQKYRREFEEAVRKFVAAYPDLIKRAKAALNGMFNELDYPPLAKISKQFDFDYTFIQCPTTDAKDFRVSLGAEHVEDIRQALEKRMASVLDGALNDTAERIMETVGHMAERLRAYKPGSEGERAEGTFRDSLVENVRDLATLLPSFNLTGDPKLTAITKRINDVLCKHDADDLREDEAVRAKTAEAAEKILADVKAFMA